MNADANSPSGGEGKRGVGGARKVAGVRAASGPLGRVHRLREALEGACLDAFVILDRANTYYFTGFECSNSATIVTRGGDAMFLTDFRYMEAATARLAGFEVRMMTQGGTDELKALIKSLGLRKVGFEGSISYDEHAKLKKAAGRVALQEAGSLPVALREVKDEQEIDLIAANQRLNEAIFKVALKAVVVGRSTESQIRQGIQGDMLKRGVEEAFGSIIAAGANSSLPHYVPAQGKVKAGGYLLFDMGVKASHYHSDMTRTVGIGKTSSRHREIYELVLAAQKAGLAAIRPGVACKDVDAAARKVISDAGHGEHFGHGLGHGVGLQIHEGPRLSKGSATVLREGMVVTVEPGVYIPGFGGVRIEDLVVVTANGYRNLTTAPKSYRELAG